MIKLRGKYNAATGEIIDIIRPIYNFKAGE